MVCLHTGFSQMILEMNKKPDAHALENACAALDGRDQQAAASGSPTAGLAALIADNYAVEAHPATSQPAAALRCRCTSIACSSSA